jgi:hypothetical protein
LLSNHGWKTEITVSMDQTSTYTCTCLFAKKDNQSHQLISWMLKVLNFPIYTFKKTASVVFWSEFLLTDPEVRVRFLALPDFLRSSGSELGSSQPREYNWGDEKVAGTV